MTVGDGRSGAATANGENPSLLVTKLQATATLIPDSLQVPVSSVDLGWIFPAVRKREVLVCVSVLFGGSINMASPGGRGPSVSQIPSTNIWMPLLM